MNFRLFFLHAKWRHLTCKKTHKYSKSRGIVAEDHFLGIMSALVQCLDLHFKKMCRDCMSLNQLTLKKWVHNFFWRTNPILSPQLLLTNWPKPIFKLLAKIGEKYKNIANLDRKFFLTYQFKKGSTVVYFSVQSLILGMLG